jgi:hypothetical protein
LRDLAAYTLVGATGLWLLVAIIQLIPDGPDQFAGRTESSFDHFVNLPTIVFPIAAVLLALVVRPRHPKARLIVLAALGEYAVAVFFGVFFGLLIGLINTAADGHAREAFENLLIRIGWLAVLAVAAYAVYLIWQNLFSVPKPPPAAPGVYGQSPQFNPGAFPGQPGYGPPSPGHPGPPPAPGGFGPTTYGQTYGQPPQNAPQNPPWNQAPMQPHSGPPFPPGSPAAPAPAPAPAQFSAPQSAPPYLAPPQSTPFSEPTQAVPQQPPADRTEKIDEPRPGFGPAEPDAPRS